MTISMCELPQRKSHQNTVGHTHHNQYSPSLDCSLALSSDNPIVCALIRVHNGNHIIALQ